MGGLFTKPEDVNLILLKIKPVSAKSANISIQFKNFSDEKLVYILKDEKSREKELCFVEKGQVSKVFEHRIGETIIIS